MIILCTTAVSDFVICMAVQCRTVRPCTAAHLPTFISLQTSAVMEADPGLEAGQAVEAGPGQAELQNNPEVNMFN